MPSHKPITQLLTEAQQGDRAALDELLPLVYTELRRLAAAHLRRERHNHTLQPTALVHEAYLRLVDQRQVDWRDRAQFFGLAAEMMRRILVNHAVHRRTQKRGDGAAHVELNEAISFAEQKDAELLRLDEALTELARFDPAQSRIVELRYFGGLTVEETAEVLGISPATVKREWRAAKAWLHRAVAGGG